MCIYMSLSVRLWIFRKMCWLTAHGLMAVVGLLWMNHGYDSTPVVHPGFQQSSVARVWTKRKVKRKAGLEPITSSNKIYKDIEIYIKRYIKQDRNTHNFEYLNCHNTRYTYNTCQLLGTPAQTQMLPGQAFIPDKNGPKYKKGHTYYIRSKSNDTCIWQCMWASGSEPVCPW